MAVISFDIDEKTYRRFRAELMANDEDIDTVMIDLVQLYIEQSLSCEFTSGIASRSFHAETLSLSPKKEKASIEGKANRKIPIWLERKNVPYKIIRAYLMLAGPEMSKLVDLKALEEMCTSGCDESVYVNNFKSNFAQMKFDGEKSHGKVFFVSSLTKDGSFEIVSLDDAVEKTIKKYRERFLE